MSMRLKRKNTPINLADRKQMLELMKKLYGHNESAHEQEDCDTQRKPGAKVASEVAKSSSTT